jgi:uncharacterized protein
MKHSGTSFIDFRLIEYARRLYTNADPAHDFSHILRVYENARQIGEKEGADMQVLFLSALLHDAGQGPKSAEKSQLNADVDSLKTAEEFLIAEGIPEDVREKILYAVDVHRFSKGIKPETLEARILQDADRLDALGAIGIARVFLTGGSLNRELYNSDDPFCKNREPDDKRWNLDHFYSKLLKLESGMHTETARAMAGERSAVMRRYLSDLQKEIDGEKSRRAKE